MAIVAGQASLAGRFEVLYRVQDDWWLRPTTAPGIALGGLDDDGEGAVGVDPFTPHSLSHKARSKPAPLSSG